MIDRLLGATRRWGITLLAFSVAASVVLAVDPPSGGALVTTVPLGSAADFGVLGSSTVTNTGLTSVDGNVGLWSGTSVTGFPPGVLVPPSTIEAGNTVAEAAQADLGVAYDDAAARAIDTDTPSELGSQTLIAGVYGTPTKGALTLTGSLVLDGANDPSSVFIFQTDTTLNTASDSTVTLINGAQECNVFWQIGSSATLGTGTDFAGNILAFASITLTTGVKLRGRALAHGAAVTTDTNTIVAPTCDLVPPTTTTTTTVPTTTTTTTAPASTTTTTTTVPTTTTTTTVPTTTTTTTVPTTTTTTTVPTTTTTTTVPTTTTTTTATVPTTTTTATVPTTTTIPGAAATTTTTSGSAADPIARIPRAPAGPSTQVGRADGSPRGVPVVVPLTADGVPAVTGAPRTGGAPLRENEEFPWLPVAFVVLLVGVGLSAIPKPRHG